MFNAIIAFVVAVAIYVVYHRYFHRLSQYPGPFLASVTDVWRFWVCFIVGDHHLTDKRLHDVYGPVVRIGPNTLSFSTVPAAQAIYGFNKSMTKGAFYACFGDPDPEKANMFQTRTAGKHHELRRKMVSGALVPSRTSMYEPIVTKTVRVLMDQLIQLRRNSKTVVNMAPHVHLFAMDTFFEMTHGTSMNFQTVGYDGHGGAAAEQRYLTKSGFRISLLPWLATILQPISYIQMVRKATYNEHGQARGFYAVIDTSKRAQASAPQDAPSLEPCILKNLIEVDPEDDRRMEGMELWRELFNASMAGTGSISACLTMILYHLGTHVEWQTRILQEVKTEMCFSNPNLSLESAPYLVLAKCHALGAVINESLRVSPPFPAAFPRDIASGAESAIPGLPAPLPLGTTVQANVYVVSHSCEFWGDDADEWRPSRWLKGDKRLEEGFLIFGRGSRSCVGKDISRMALMKVIFALLCRWKLTAKPESLKGRNYFEMQYEQLLVELQPHRD